MHSCDQLLLDLGQTAGLSQPLRFDDHGCARLMVGTHLALDFERDAEAGVIQLYSVLGPAPAQGDAALYRQLLEANLFGADTAGATLAIDGPMREIVLCRSISAEGLAAPAFVQTVEQFIAAAEDWKERLAAHQPGAAAPGAAAEGASAAAPLEIPVPGLGAFLRA